MNHAYKLAALTVCATCSLVCATKVHTAKHRDALIAKKRISIIPSNQNSSKHIRKNEDEHLIKISKINKKKLIKIEQLLKQQSLIIENLYSFYDHNDSECMDKLRAMDRSSSLNSNLLPKIIATAAEHRESVEKAFQNDQDSIRLKKIGRKLESMRKKIMLRHTFSPYGRLFLQE